MCSSQTFSNKVRFSDMGFGAGPNGYFINKETLWGQPPPAARRNTAPLALIFGWSSARALHCHRDDERLQSPRYLRG